MSGYVVFDGSPHFHALKDEDETACGVMVGAVAFLAARPPKLMATKPHGVMPCGRCFEVPAAPPVKAGRTSGEIEVDDWVQIVAGPHSGRVGRVTRVIRGKGEADSTALFRVRFSDGGEAGHVGANLKKANS